MSYQAGLVFKSLGSKQSSCVPVAKPVVYEVPKLVVAAAVTSGDVFIIPAGEPTGLGGYIDNTDQCLSYNITLRYLYGSDCDSCTNAPLLSDKITVFVPAGAVFNLPQVYWDVISYEVVDPSGVPIATGAPAEASFGFSSIHTPACPKCTPLVGDVVEPLARLGGATSGAVKK